MELSQSHHNYDHNDISSQLSLTNMELYKMLLFKTKESLGKKSEIPLQFASVLNDCALCISKSFNIIVELLSDSEVQLIYLIEYMDNIGCLLILLTDYLKNAIECVSLSCCSLKTFPITTGQIIIMVFNHCKDSELLYGSHIIKVEKQLKDLFRSCHELQLVYLMIFEKHFSFNFTDTEEMAVFIEALEVNLKIGEIVQTLDVKTMAEQWKAFTAICEKHSTHLNNKKIFNMCTKILCSIMENNLKIALEVNQEDKVMLRSLKVCSFILKILLKICNIFRHITANNYEYVVDMMIFIHRCNVVADQKSNFSNLMNSNILIPSSSLLGELLTDEAFFDTIYHYNVDDTKMEDKLPGYILLIISIMKLKLIRNDVTEHICAQKLMDCVYNILSYGPTYFYVPLTNSKSKLQNLGSVSLYQYLLTHMLAVAMTMNSEQYCALQRNMYEAILGTDIHSAKFSSDLWVFLARKGSRSLLMNQLLFLCYTYQRLENHYLFHNSPQRIYISHILSRLFENMSDVDKVALFKKYGLNDDSNFGLWSVLKIENLPEHIRRNTEGMIVENCKKCLHKLAMSSVRTFEEMDILIKTIKLAATSTYPRSDPLFECNLIKTWMKLCCKGNKGYNCLADVWCLKFLEALVSLTNYFKCIFESSANVIKILHVISYLVENGCLEIKLILVELICTILNCSYANQEFRDDENKDTVENLLDSIFKYLLKDADDLIEEIIFTTLKKYCNKNVKKLFEKYQFHNYIHRDRWSEFLNSESNIDLIEINHQMLKLKNNISYEHKCYGNFDVNDSEVIEVNDTDSIKNIDKKCASDNFDLADIDVLLDVESDSEPEAKKVKFNCNEMNAIVSRLENDTALLCDVKENVNLYKTRLKHVCDKLNNMIN